jgi:hypothetical protein
MYKNYMIQRLSTKYCQQVLHKNNQNIFHIITLNIYLNLFLVLN